MTREIELFFNWIRICIRFRAIAPWIMRRLDLEPLEKKDMEWVEKHTLPHRRR